MAFNQTQFFVGFGFGFVIFLASTLVVFLTIL